MLKIVILVSFFICFASSKFLLDSEIPISYHVNGVEVAPTLLRAAGIPPTPNDTQNVLYKLGKRVTGDEVIVWAFSNEPEYLNISKINVTSRMPNVGTDTGCLITAMELLIAQRPNVDQSIRVLEGGFGQRYLHFQYVYQNMVRSFHYKKIYGICDHRNESNY